MTTGFVLIIIPHILLISISRILYYTWTGVLFRGTIINIINIIISCNHSKQKKDPIFLCACNSWSRAMSRSLRSQGSFIGSMLFSKAQQIYSHICPYFVQMFPQCFRNNAECSNHHRNYFHFHQSNLTKFCGQVLVLLDLFHHLRS